MTRIRTHPGEILKEEFMKPLGLSANGLARELHVPPNRVLAIAKRQRAVTADSALRFARYFGTTPEFWLNLQSSYDMSVAVVRSKAEIDKKVRPRAA